MTEALLAYEDLQDPYGIQFWPSFVGRDGCRTPMTWSHNAESGGFTTGKPWLPLPPEHNHLSSNLQEGDPDSLLNHYRAALKFRASEPVFMTGSIRFLEGSDSVLVFEREQDGTTVFVAINMSDAPQVIAAPTPDFVTMESPGTGGSIADNKLTLDAYGSYFGRMQQTAKGGETA